MSDFIKKVSANLRLLNRPDKRISIRGTPVVGFQLRKDGSITSGSLKLLAASGGSDLDAMALSSVQTSTPSQPFPESVKVENIDLRLTFRFGVLPDAPFRSLYESAQRAVSNRDLSTAAQLLESLLAQDSDYTNGWNFLGWIYNQLGRFDKAALAFQKAILASPFDTFAYNNLGQAFAGQKKFAEAIPYYLKQIEINPNDRWAHANLGRVYLQLNQPGRAVSALETAVSITPRDPTVHFNLARAYAARHENDKALKSFQRSVEIEPVPPRWNSVAYQLAQNDIALDQAAGYANSAIAAVVARLREASVDSLSNDDLRNTNALAAYWDTYGWIRFQQGNLAEAEKYVRCAWLLHAIGEDADHLAQIYEKQGRKADAINLYELALAAPFPHTESRTRLAALIGSDGGVDESIEKARLQLTALRTIPVTNAHDLDGVAEFWILIAPGPRVLGTKFITGDEVLRPFVKELTSARFPDFFPEATETQLVRRGRLSCTHAPASQCNLLLASAESVRSAE